MSRQDDNQWQEVRDRLRSCANAIDAALGDLVQGPRPEASPTSPRERQEPAPQGHASQHRPPPQHNFERRPIERRSLSEGSQLEILTFTVALERFAIEQTFVKSTATASITAIPISNPALRGAAAIEDTLVPVFDLGRIFGLRPADDPTSERLLVLGTGSDELALLASDPHETSTFEVENLVEVPWEIAADDAALVRGVTPDGSILLDAAALLSDPRLQLVPSA